MPFVHDARSKPRKAYSILPDECRKSSPNPVLVGALARRAMVAELSATPKPGLVDRHDPGSHDDMDVDTLTVSIDVIHPFLVRVAEYAGGAEANLGTLTEARRIGLEAERAMFAATGGVNTHKGQIFVLTVLLTGAVCRSPFPSLGTLSDVPSLDRWRAAIRRLTFGIVERELSGLCDQRSGLSHGERLYLAHRVTGIRGEAQAGFPAIFEIGLPAYRLALAAGSAPNDAAVHALLQIMTTAEDTTVIHRGGIEALQYVRASAQEALSLGDVSTGLGRAYIRRMNETFIARSISPGGSADLLAGTIFAHSIEAFGA